MSYRINRQLTFKASKIKIWDAPPHRFETLDVNYYFPNLTNQLITELHDSQCITDSGFTGDRLNKLGILQVCLLKTKPFDFDGSLRERANMIQDVRTGQKYICQDRSKLLESLAESLSVFQGRFFRLYQNIERRLEGMKMNSKHMQSVVSTYFDLRSRSIITPASSVKHLHQKTIEKSFESICEILNSITYNDYEKIVRHSHSNFSDNEVKLKLIKNMWASFELYAPKRYCKDANRHAIAAILSTFMIEEGDCATIVERIAQRLRRAEA